MWRRAGGTTGTVALSVISFITSSRKAVNAGSLSVLISMRPLWPKLRMCACAHSAASSVVPEGGGSPPPPRQVFDALKSTLGREAAAEFAKNIPASCYKLFDKQNATTSATGKLSDDENLARQQKLVTQLEEN